MIHCKELDTSFETKEALFLALKKNKEKIISIKKKNLYTGYNVLNPENSKQVVSNKQTKLKSLSVESTKSLFKDSDYYYFAVNTTGILDSHGDLHVKGIWTKSAKEQSRKNYLVDTHQLTVKTTIAYPEDVEIFVATIPFKSLGYSYKGNTEALVYKVHKDNIIGEDVKDALVKDKSLQASVKMQYVKMDLAMKSDAKEDIEERKTYDEYLSQIANKDDFEGDILYFFVQKEAKNIHESSLVPFGSNHVTGVLPSEDKSTEPSVDTQKIEAAKALQESKNLIIRNLNN